MIWCESNKVHERTVCNKCMMCMIRSFLACALDRPSHGDHYQRFCLCWAHEQVKEESVFLQVKVMHASPPWKEKHGDAPSFAGNVALKPWLLRWSCLPTSWVVRANFSNRGRPRNKFFSCRRRGLSWRPAIVINSREGYTDLMSKSWNNF